MIEHDPIIQRYDMAPYAMGWEKNDDGEVCMSTDVDRLEVEHQKLLEAHRIMKEALEWLTLDRGVIDCQHIAKREFAAKTLERVGEVMS